MARFAGREVTISKVNEDLPRPRTGIEVTVPQEERAGWTIDEAEALILSLKGVVSTRLVTRPGGEIEELHVLTSNDVGAKQTVRNVESALLAHLGISVDHRKISVAQTKDAPQERAPAVTLAPPPRHSDSRLLFQAHQVESARSRKVRHRVEIEWRDVGYQGEAAGADLPRARLEAVAEATLHAVEAALSGELGEVEGGAPPVTLALDGVKSIDAFDQRFVLVAVHAVAGRDVTPLAGATVVEESPDRATILATLQATDRWVRGRVD